MDQSQDIPSDVYYLAQLTPTDHSGIVWVVSITSLIYALISSGVRFTLRRGIYGFDDAALLVSTLACIAQHSLIFVAASNGLGKAGYGVQRAKNTLSDSTYTRIMLFFVVHCLAKVSLTLFIRRLFYGQDYVNRIICNVLLIGNIIWGVVSFMLISINCGSGWYFATHNVCSGLLSRWVALKVLDVLSEVLLVAVPIFLMCRVLLNRHHKLIIISTFAARLPVIYFSVQHYFALRHSLYTTSDRGLALVWPVIWLQFELLWSVVTASLPSFKPLVKPFHTVVTDSEEGPSNSGTQSANIMYGSQPDKQAQELTTWATVSATAANMDKLENITTGNWRTDFKAYTETTIEGPKKKFLWLGKKDQGIELGAIHHSKDFKVEYEKMAKTKRWGRMVRRDSQALTLRRLSEAPTMRKPSEAVTIIQEEPGETTAETRDNHEASVARRDET